MGSPFKMNPKTPFMKALVGKQGNLPEHLKKAILDAPAKMDGKGKKSADDDVVLDTKTETVKRKKGPGKDVVTTETSERGGKGRGTTMGDRQGVGRIQTKTYRKMEGTGGGKGSATGTKISGASGMRTLADGTKVVKEETASRIKKRGAALKSTGNVATGAGKKSTTKKTYGPQQETKEERGKRVYKEAMGRIAASKAASEKRKKEGPKKGIRVTMGMGTSFSESRIGGKKKK